MTAREVKTYLDRHMTRAVKRTWKRRQKASLTGDPDAVLARAGDGGAFPPRPALDDAVSGAGGKASEGTEAKRGSDGGAGDDSAAPVETAESVEESLGLTYEQRVLVQQGLAALGEDVGVADGVFGRRTRAGILGYQKKKGLPGTGPTDGGASRRVDRAGQGAGGRSAGRRRSVSVDALPRPRRKLKRRRRRRRRGRSGRLGRSSVIVRVLAGDGGGAVG